MDLLERAIAIAVEAHQGQFDKKGEPYILHLFRVMLAVRDRVEMQVAVLHDLLEDTPWTVEALAAEGFGPGVLRALSLLTRPRHMSYAEYVVRLKKDDLARQVKLADLADNYRLDRVAYRDPHEDEDRKRILRYVLSHQYLLGEIALGDYRRRMSELED